MNWPMRLRVETTAGDISVDQVQEYVCGKRYFYVNTVGNAYPEVKLIKRDIIHEVYRVDGESEWKVNLKTFRDR